jgi:PAS domain S-box-containing protein
MNSGTPVGWRCADKVDRSTDRESVQAVLAELAAGNPVVGFECRHVRADGTVRRFEWSTSSRPDAGVVYGVARDVTERRAAATS